MPKLLQINVTANWGSTGKIAEHIGLCAMAHGWESYIAYGRYSNTSASRLIKVGNKLDTYLHYCEQSLRDNEGLCSRRATRKLIQQIESIQPDVVHLHVIHDHYLNYRILFEYLNQTNIKVVWTMHDCWAFTGHCMHFISKDCERWKTECNGCPMQHVFPKTLLDHSRKNFELKKRLFPTHPNITLVGVSEWIGNNIKQSILCKKPIIVIPNGIDLNTFKPQSEMVNNGKFRILGVASVWKKNKGLDDFLLLRSMLSTTDYDIILVGLTSKQIKNLPQGITGIMRTDCIQELAQLYSCADVLANPTYADCFPSVNLESIACGTPVITYRTGGSPETIDDNTGAVVEKGNIEALCKKIKEFKGSRFKQHHSADCRKRAEKLFDKDKQYEKYIQLYNDLLV